MDLQIDAPKLEQFRIQLYTTLPRRADATMELLDALASNTGARSVVELSLSPAFRRGYSSVYDAIDALFSPSEPRLEWAERRRLERGLCQAVAQQLPAPVSPKPWLMSLDGLSIKRVYAHGLYDRGYVYQPDPVPGRRPVTIGHHYSLLMGLPEREAGDPAWALPLSARRVPSQDSDATVGGEQIRAVLDDPELPWWGQTVALVIDSLYGRAGFLGPLLEDEPDLILIPRLRSNRVLYRQPTPQPGKPGRPKRYGERFDLRDARTWGEADGVHELAETTHRGRRLSVRIEVWHKLLMRSERGAPMHRHPLTVLRVVCTDQTGRQVFRRPMWLALCGAKRDQIDPVTARGAYRQRFDQEHTHRFMRQRLLLDASQTPETEHEENWVTLVCLAQAVLFASRNVVQDLPRPWERPSARPVGRPASPTRVQRDLERVLRQLGTPAQPPKRRGKSPGRAKGDFRHPRCRFPVVKKTSRVPKAA